MNENQLLLVPKKRRNLSGDVSSQNICGYSQMREYSSIEKTAETTNTMTDAEKELLEYIRKNRARLLSESDIFGTLSIEVRACHVKAVLKILEAKGGVLKEKPSYPKPLRRGTMVRLVFYSKNLGIINTPI